MVDHHHQSTHRLSEGESDENPSRKSSFFLSRKVSAPMAETSSVDEELDTARMEVSRDQAILTLLNSIPSFRQS